MDEPDRAAGSPLAGKSVAEPLQHRLGRSLATRAAGILIFRRPEHVVDDEDPEALESLLTDKATGEPLEQDGEGIYWERDSLSNTWIAHSRYGDNVVLAWFSESAEPETDERWERLDDILAGLTTG